MRRAWIEVKLLTNSFKRESIFGSQKKSETVEATEGRANLAAGDLAKAVVDQAQLDAANKKAKEAECDYVNDPASSACQNKGSGDHVKTAAPR